MSEEELEFALSEYHDGTLPAARRAEIEEILRTDAAARRKVEQFARLDALMRDGAARMPEIQWDRLAEHLSGAIDRSQRQRQVVSYPIWLYRGVGLAAAAAILVALGLFAEFGSMHGGSPVQQTMVADADIAPPAAAAAEADEVAEVSVDQPAADSAVAQDYASANSVLVHRPVISLAGFTPVEGTQVH